VPEQRQAGGLGSGASSSVDVTTADEPVRPLERSFSHTQIEKVCKDRLLLLHVLLIHNSTSIFQYFYII
jgi:hypothetical protein